jgi:hypothetical protein
MKDLNTAELARKHLCGRNQEALKFLAEQDRITRERVTRSRTKKYKWTRKDFKIDLDALVKRLTSFLEHCDFLPPTEEDKLIEVIDELEDLADDILLEAKK